MADEAFAVESPLCVDCSRRRPMLRMLCFECHGYRQGQVQHDRPRVKFHLAGSGREVWPVGWRDGGVPWSFMPKDLQQSVWF